MPAHPLARPTALASAFALALALTLAFATPAAAQQAASADTTPRLRGMARFGLEHGGDEVLQFEYEDGSKPKVIAGGGLHLSVGAAYRAIQTNAGGLDAQLGLGLKWRTIPPADNQEANWLRFPVDAMLMFRSTRGFGIGAGATAHLANALKVSGDVADGKLEFGSGPGFVVQGEYAWRGAIVDLRYTAIQYELADVAAEKIDASNIGIGVTVMFGRGGMVR